MHESTMKFEELLDTCVTSIHTGELGVAQCVARHPTEREQLEPLLYLVDRLYQGRQVVAPAAFRQEAPRRLRELIDASTSQPITQTTTNPPKPARWQPFLQAAGARGPWSLLRTVAAALLIILVTMTTGAYAVGNALPGTALYPAKTSLEDLSVALAASDVAGLRLHLRYAERRLDESEILAEKRRFVLLGTTIEAYRHQLDFILDYLSPSTMAPVPQQVDVARELNLALASHEMRLETLLQQASDETQSTVEAALDTWQVGRQRATQILENLEDSNAQLPGSGSPNGVTRTATPSPRSTPTSTGTKTATAVPSATPTSAPSPPATQTPRPTRGQPTDLPHSLPTDLPALFPTGWPTDIPGRWPTRLPTGVPANWPTGLPANLPTGLPANLPTGLPANLPTGLPANLPTGLPTTWPTVLPTSWPTNFPTVFPTAWPTNIPTGFPPAFPTAWPTTFPTSFSDAFPTPPPRPPRPPVFPTRRP